jgi:hypothetical protein
MKCAGLARGWQTRRAMVAERSQWFITTKKTIRWDTQVFVYFVFENCQLPMTAQGRAILGGRRAKARGTQPLLG